MWMAVVLVCLGGVKSDGSCFTFISKTLHRSEEACFESIIIGNELGAFSVPSNDGKKFLPTDYICYNWDEEGDPV